jgi:hypothetical protein
MSMNDPARADYVNLCVNLPVTAHCPEPIVVSRFSRTTWSVACTDRGQARFACYNCGKNLT